MEMLKIRYISKNWKALFRDAINYDSSSYYANNIYILKSYKKKIEKKDDID